MCQFQSKNPETNEGNANEDLRLGTLLVPLAHLPLEDEIPTVERWYQLVTLNPSTPNSPTRNRSLDSNSGVPAEKNPNNLSSPHLHRSPSVLLEISLCSSQTLDDNEEQAFLCFGDEVGEGTDDEDYEWVGESKDATMADFNDDPVFENSHSSQRNRKRTSSNYNVRHSLGDDKLKLQIQKEKEKIEKDGPPIKPGIVDYICVVGAKDNGDICNLDASKVKKGWLESESDSCLLEQFPSNDEVHVRQGR
jgi:hypothetical protein